MRNREYHLHRSSGRCKSCLKPRRFRAWAGCTVDTGTSDASGTVCNRFMDQPRSYGLIPCQRLHRATSFTSPWKTAGFSSVRCCRSTRSIARSLTDLAQNVAPIAAPLRAHARSYKNEGRLVSLPPPKDLRLSTVDLRLSTYVRRYLLNQSIVRCHASLAAASSYRGVVSLWNP
jgi:hypothetical protein